MHTTEFVVKETDYHAPSNEWYDKRRNFVVIHNGDFSGNVRIYEAVPGAVIEEVELPFDLLVQIVAEHLRSVRISALEQMEPGDIITMTWEA